MCEASWFFFFWFTSAAPECDSPGCHALQTQSLTQKSKWYLIRRATRGGRWRRWGRSLREVTQLGIRPQPVPLWTCPDIKQSWNLTHTSYIDLHSLATPFEEPWRCSLCSVLGLNAKGRCSGRESHPHSVDLGGGGKKKKNLSAQSQQSLHGRRTIRCVDFDVFYQNLQFVFRRFSPRFSGILAMEK